jgi:sulfur carrier protein ThiS
LKKVLYISVNAYVITLGVSALSNDRIELFTFLQGGLKTAA